MKRTVRNHHFLNNFLSFITFLAIFPTISISGNNLTATQFLIGNQTLVSPGDVFELGFFTLENPGEWYVGIWYKNVPVKTYVWVANRDKPLTNSPGIFKVEDRNLVFLDQGRNLVWSSNITKGDGNPVAELLDTGNLVLREAKANSDTNQFLWQSFDYPTDTMLPEMKLGWDRKTGLQRFLTAWRARGDPSSGDFSFKLDYHGFPELFLWNKQEKVYRSGPWVGQKFSGDQESYPSDYINLINFNFTAKQDEVYFTFSIKNDFFSRLVVTSNGDLRRLTWIPNTKQWNIGWELRKDQCDHYKECGPFGICDSNASPVCKCPKGFTPKNLKAWNLRDWSGGCVRKTNLECAKDKFLRLPNIKPPECTTSFVDRNMNLKGCEALCARNCSCTAYSVSNWDSRNGGKGCVIWTVELIDIRQFTNGGLDLFVRLAASDFESVEKKQNKSNRIPLVASLSATLGLVLFLSFGFFIWKRRNIQEDKENSQEAPLFDLVVSSVPNEHSRENFSLENVAKSKEFPLIQLDILHTATNHFSDENKLGEGGFGPVYKSHEVGKFFQGTLPDGKEIAVKRLSGTSGQGLIELKNEVILIARLQHKNLVRLLGCCLEKNEKLLVYEFMHNRSLDVFLFDSSLAVQLDWQKRFSIIKGIARGIMYLHEDSRLRIIHRDLKASNVLLDHEMNPKISDFGIARIFGGDQNEANTNRVVGTYGYMAPEYAMKGHFSTKSDVFSFGVLLLEIISGRKNNGFNFSEHGESLLTFAWKLWCKDEGMELVDQLIVESCVANEVLKCIHIGLLCVQANPTARPTMSSVVAMLGSDTMALPLPAEPAFYIGHVVAESIQSTSNGTLTISNLLPR